LETKVQERPTYTVNNTLTSQCFVSTISPTANCQESLQQTQKIVTNSRKVSMNCQPGDLAFIVRSSNPENLMKIVEVIKAYDPADCGIVVTDESRQVWLCESRGSPIVWSDQAGVAFLRGMSGPIPDECLWPIRPGQEHDSDKLVAGDPAPTAAAQLQHA
jgi:hypothetical protein